MKLSTILVLFSLLAGSAAFAQTADDGQSPDAADLGDGQNPALAAMARPRAAIATQLTYRSHTIAPGASAYTLEGNVCPVPTKMVSGACHPGYNDRVIIINQYPNVGANTWRCGFKTTMAARGPSGSTRLRAIGAGPQGKDHAMTRTLLLGAAMALVSLGQTAAAQEAPGQDPMLAGLEALSAALGNTEITWRSHSVAGGGSTFAAEGTSCPANTKMLSGACHPGYSDQVILINQYPTSPRIPGAAVSRTTAPRPAPPGSIRCAPPIRERPACVQHDLSVRRFSSTPADQRRCRPDHGRCDHRRPDRRFRGRRRLQYRDAPGPAMSPPSRPATGRLTVLPNSAPSSARPAGSRRSTRSTGAAPSARALSVAAPVPGSSFAIVRYTASLEGIRWLHEFAHNKVAQPPQRHLERHASVDRRKPPWPSNR